MKISEVAKKVNLSLVTLRYYEKMGLIPPVQRQQGVREYRIEDLNWINFIKCLRQVQIPVKDLKQYTELILPRKKDKTGAAANFSKRIATIRKLRAKAAGNHSAVKK